MKFLTDRILIVKKKIVMKRECTVRHSFIYIYNVDN